MANINILEKIEKMYPNLTGTQKVIATSILMDPMLVAFSPIKVLSEKYQVSAASIVRFAQRITDGQGYQELQDQIQIVLRSTTNPIKRLEENSVITDQDTTLISEVYETQFNNLQQTYNVETIKSVVKASNLIANASRIYTYGSRGCYATAYYLGHHLNRVYNNTDIISDDDRLVEFLVRIHSDDLVIIVGLPRYSRRMLLAVKKIKELGASLISITASPTSPFVAYSDVSIYASCNSCDFHNSQITSMFVAEMLISQAISDNMRRATDNLHKTEEMLTSLKQFYDSPDKREPL